MKVLVLGATGATGKLTVGELLGRSHQVTGLARNPERFAPVDGVRVTPGGATSEVDVAKALEGQDALISTLGGGKGMSSTIASDAARVFVPAAERPGVRRVEVMSAFGVRDSLLRANDFQRLMSSLAMKKVFADKAVADKLLRKGSLGWTIVQPTTLTNRPKIGRPRVGESMRMRAPQPCRAQMSLRSLPTLAHQSTVRRTRVVTS